MKKSSWFAACVFLVSVLAVGSTWAVANSDPDGKTIFLDQKCNTCHSIESVGIEARMKQMKAPDLSNASGMDIKPDWLKKFLLQEELKDGKKHLKKFSGDEKQLTTLVDWIENLKKS